jgi:hypothetical protein
MQQSLLSIPKVSGLHGLDSLGSWANHSILNMNKALIK